MSKNVLIIESDASAGSTLRAELEQRGFLVEDTRDWKGAVEQVRQRRPDLVTLAVGQSGYLICGKLKKDDGLKVLPVIVVGNAESNAQHRKLKTRADAYLDEPVSPEVLIDRVSELIGLPEGSGELIEESLTLEELVDEEPLGAEFSVVEEDTVSGDPELDMLDAAFDGIAEPQEVLEEPVTFDAFEDGGFEGEGSTQVGLEPPDDLGSGDPESFGALEEEEPVIVGEEEEDVLAGLGESSAAVPELAFDDGGFQEEAPSASSEADDAIAALGLDELAPAAAPLSAPRPKAPPARPPASGGAGAAALTGAQAAVERLTAELEQAHSRSDLAEARVADLEAELAAKAAELEANRGGSTRSDKDFFALREAQNRKDKEILRLKGELNEKDQEIVELRDREMALEQQLSEATSEAGRKDAQLKSLSVRAEQAATEKRRFDQQLAQAREDLRAAQAATEAVRAEAEPLRAELEDAIARGEALGAELEAAREEAQSSLAELEGARAELTELGERLAQTEESTGAARSELAEREEEAQSLRARLAELEETTGRNEERLTRLYQRIKGDEQLRDRTKKALGIALQLLEEQPSVDEEEEPAVA